MSEFIPYARQSLDEDDIQAVVEVLRSDFLTTGPKVTEFEQAVADYCGAAYAVAFSSGTAALHGAMHVLGVGRGDEVITTPITFAATANAVLYQGGRPVFADVRPGDLLLDPEKVEALITPATRGIAAVDYAGHPCDYHALGDICRRKGLFLLADACHALGGEYRGRKVGTLAGLTVLSFHPVKHLATGEGGMVLTNNPDLAQALQRFRNHGIDRAFNQRGGRRPWFYAMVELGYNYRLSDIQCALGLSQLKKLPGWLERRRRLADRYQRAFAGMEGVEPLAVSPEVAHAYHLYVVRLTGGRPPQHRDRVFLALREQGIGVNLHYIPVYLHPYYQELGYRQGLCPVAEDAYHQIISLPMFPALSDQQQERVIAAVEKALAVV